MTSDLRHKGGTIRPLISSVTPESAPASPLKLPHGPPKLLATSFRRQRALLKSKGALMILVWNIYVGFVYGIMLDVVVMRSVIQRGSLQSGVFIFLGGFAMIALFQLLAYPISGLIADLCCGRYRVIFLGVFKLWLGMLPICISGVIYISKNFEAATGGVSPSIISLYIAVFLLFGAGFSGFQANAVQFGLDQLLDASSEELSVFLHWLEWTRCLGEFGARLLGSFLPCSVYSTKVLPFIPIPIVLASSLLLVLSYHKRKWFHREPRTHNPYGMVYRVLKFAAQHSKPLRRSAFAYCDDERPTRMECAKQRFGGPFTTETVEDVKTFLRILVMLLLITPFFHIHVATDYIFPPYAVHLGSDAIDNTNGCTTSWILLQSGSCNYMVTVLILPLYITFIHPKLPRWMPRILHRLVVGVAVLVVTVALMLGLLIAAKHAAIARNEDTTCLFLAEFRHGIANDTSSSRLHFHTSVLILPSILNGLTTPLIYISILEFISAQSPHSMKGLLLGVFYAFRGFFVMLGCLSVLPFTRAKWWASSSGKVYDCGFSYYLASTVLGLVGIVTVSIGIKWYHYRDRQDKPYGPRYAEDYYSRYAQQQGMVASAEEASYHAETNKSILAYGTMEGT